MVANLDGSESKVLVKDQVRCATSLRVDLPRQVLYWTDSELHLVEEVDIDTNQRRVRPLNSFRKIK